MKDFLNRNKFTIISMVFYTLTVLIFGDLSGLKLPYFILLLILFPIVYNWKLRKYQEKKDPIWIFIVVGLIFGQYLTPFNFTSFGDLSKSIPYWVNLVTLNLFFSFNRNSYKERVKYSDKSDTRDDKIDQLLNPVKRRFFQ